MQANAEHQQHHADLGQLGGNLQVGNEAGRRRADDDSRQQIANECRHAQTLGNHTKDQRDAKTRCQRRNQGDVVLHAENISIALAASMSRRVTLAGAACPQAQRVKSPAIESATGLWSPHDPHLAQRRPPCRTDWPSA